MSDPPRLLDDPDASPLGRSLLASAADDAPDPDRRGAAARRLGISAALLVSAATSKGGATAIGAALWWKVGVLVIMLGGATAIVVSAASSEEAPAVSPPVVVASQPARPDPSPRPDEAQPAPAAEPAQPPEPTATAVAPAPTSPPVRRKQPRVVAPVEHVAVEPALVAAEPPAPQPAPQLDARRLAAEVALLDRARGALRARDTIAARHALDEHARAFSDGALLAEAEVIRIEILMQRADHAAATSRARTFLSTFPRSPLARRVRSLLERASKETP